MEHKLGTAKAEGDELGAAPFDLLDRVGLGEAPRLRRIRPDVMIAPGSSLGEN